MRWRWHFFGLINSLQLWTAVTFMVLQFIVSHCCDCERQNEKSFFLHCWIEAVAHEREKEKNFSFQQMTLPFFIFALNVLELFFLFTFPPHSFITSILFYNKTAQTKKEATGVIVFQQKLSDYNLEMRQWRRISERLGILKAFILTIFHSKKAQIRFLILHSFSFGVICLEQKNDTAFLFNNHVTFIILLSGWKKKLKRTSPLSSWGKTTLTFDGESHLKR